MKITAGTTIEVPNHKDLLAAWKSYGDLSRLLLVERFIVSRPLTASQYRRLPVALKNRLQSDDVLFLERLFNLPDPRDSEPQ